MRIFFVAELFLSAVLCGCGPSEPKPVVDSRTPEQIVAQGILDRHEAEEKARAEADRLEEVLEKIDTLDKAERCVAIRKQILQDVADGKITVADSVKLNHELDEKILSGKF